MHWTDNNNWLLSSLVLLFGVTAPLFLVCGTPELSEEAYEFVVRRWWLWQAAATALEAHPDFNRRLHRHLLPCPVTYLHHCSQLTGQCILLRLHPRTRGWKTCFWGKAVRISKILKDFWVQTRPDTKLRSRKSILYTMKLMLSQDDVIRQNSWSVLNCTINKNIKT